VHRSFSFLYSPLLSSLLLIRMSSSVLSSCSSFTFVSSIRFVRPVLADLFPLRRQVSPLSSVVSSDERWRFPGDCGSIVTRHRALRGRTKPKCPQDARGKSAAQAAWSNANTTERFPASDPSSTRLISALVAPRVPINPAATRRANVEPCRLLSPRVSA